MAEQKQNLVGLRVRRLRMDAGLSQEAFAARLQLAGWDLSRGGLSKIEAGLRRVNDAEHWRLAKALGIAVGDVGILATSRVLQAALYTYSNSSKR